jgi:hypothetical protein
MNEIEFPADQFDYREVEAANADDASSIRARATPPANEANARDVPGSTESTLDEATQARMKKIRDADRKKYERRAGPGTPEDDGVQQTRCTGSRDPAGRARGHAHCFGRALDNG